MASISNIFKTNVILIIWRKITTFRIKNKHFFACMQILTNQRIISWKKQMVSNLIRKITCSSWDNESIQSRQIYDVIILVHQTEIGTFLSAVHVGRGVSSGVSSSVASSFGSRIIPHQHTGASCIWVLIATQFFQRSKQKQVDSEL